MLTDQDIAEYEEAARSVVGMQTITGADFAKVLAEVKRLRTVYEKQVEACEKHQERWQKRGTDALAERDTARQYAARLRDAAATMLRYYGRRGDACVDDLRAAVESST